MTLDDKKRQRARQDMLEAVTSGLAGPACAPMPGVLLEMLEIAAMERSRKQDDRYSHGAEETPLLTRTPNSSRMVTQLLCMGRAIIHGANRLRAGFDGRQLPV